MYGTLMYSIRYSTSQVLYCTDYGTTPTTSYSYEWLLVVRTSVLYSYIQYEYSYTNTELLATLRVKRTLRLLLNNSLPVGHGQTAGRQYEYEYL